MEQIQQTQLIDISQLNFQSQKTLDQTVTVQGKQQQTRDQSKHETEIESNKLQTIDPIKQLIDNCDPLPIVAVLNHYHLQDQIQPGKPLINFLCNKFLPLDIIMEGKKVQLKPDSAGKTPLHYAVEVDDVKSAYWCLQNGNSHSRDEEGVSPIITAVKKGYRRCFLLLLEYKHYDQLTAHVAAEYNRVWQMQVLNSLKYNLIGLKDTLNRTSTDVAVENYSYQAAEYLTNLQPKSFNIQRLQNLTDSTAIIHRIQKTRFQNLWMNRCLIPLMKVLLSWVGMFVLTQLAYSTAQYRIQYQVFFGALAALYIQMWTVGRLASNGVNGQPMSNINDLLKVPDFPVLQQTCPKCLKFKTNQYDHCDLCGCCVRKLHYHDWMCINQSNQNIWAVIELYWLYILWHIISTVHQTVQIYSGDNLSIIPKLLMPFKWISDAANNSDLSGVLLALFGVSLLLQQIMYCIEIFGVIFMGKTYAQVNNSEKYPHLYRTVKLKDGTLRNKERKLYEDGIAPGTCYALGNTWKFFFK